ncbi:nitrite reductase large subunit NirB [uncultured Nevskia sp.]|uniref:nitrite reductase large subunit NirB n=1 Tax=uncultured Nevskia sp. TaxID=228950 RepID=UPI0025D4956A|nr:nitrite reductase large subunit NirB [uncultured Nevskia sp.]
MKLVVIGNGMVGHKLLEELADAPNLAITVLCEEPRPAYDRVHLSEFFSGKTADDLSLVTPGFFDRANITLKLNAKAVGIDRAAKLVQLEDGETVPYDQLVLATGSYPFVPPVTGRDRNGCLVYRTIEDLEAMTEWGKKSKVGVVVGGGLLGLECAKALKDMGLQTHVVEFAPRLMTVQVDDMGGRLLRRKIEAMGVQVHTGKNTLEITDGAGLGVGGRHAMKFADGSQLQTDMIVFSAGIRPRDELARVAGLIRGERGGILIDNQCKTSDPSIYAIGECALWQGKIFGLVAPGYDMARIVAKQIVAGDAAASAPQFNGADMSTKLKLLGVDVASIGDAQGTTPGSLTYLFNDDVAGHYKKLVVTADGKQLIGAVLVGEANDYGTLLQMALNGIPLPAQPESLILPSVEGGSKGIGIDMLPATASICSCNNVSKGDLCSAIEGGATSLGALKKCTKAATSCGGCLPLVKQVLDAELKKSGVLVLNHLCEHFAHSRQELFHLVKVGGQKTFDETILAHGKGRGCDVCKPTVASIVASCWNEHVLKPKHASVQDTNDYYLANIQKDGTYSVVPRIPGGEITPDKLIVIGQVAKDYGLYTKITGGQRIDLFGARVEQLPEIWGALVAAGFESGHAYGKSLRTVKSCVGSTWCRYGVQDSVTMAIRIEERYRGLRSPHKIKMAVSGCTRECAEAQSKDVGVIATEKGWNLYVAGNGGMKPRHAELLASDVDDETLIKLIDRFLMLYIRTGDRLQRTATWIENLEGGLSYVKKVVIEDSLGLCAELEADMARQVETYECEWKKAITTPETLKRFSHFVNSKEADANIQFVDERGQIRPKSALEKKLEVAP